MWTGRWATSNPICRSTWLGSPRAFVLYALYGASRARHLIETPVMRTDSRLSRMLHVLLHMARDERPVTSEQIAQMRGTNAAVVHRTMAGLRKAGYVRANKGYNGGWSLSDALHEVTLLDIFHAVGGPRIFAIASAHIVR